MKKLFLVLSMVLAGIVIVTTTVIAETGMFSGENPSVFNDDMEVEGYVYAEGLIETESRIQAASNIRTDKYLRTKQSVFIGYGETTSEGLFLSDRTADAYVHDLTDRVGGVENADPGWEYGLGLILRGLNGHEVYVIDDDNYGMMVENGGYVTICTEEGEGEEYPSLTVDGPIEFSVDDTGDNASITSTDNGSVIIQLGS